MDRTRLTQHGMMVGTVAYMPPEQALGGETMPQADLYSLGAMLYELVTGQPPFEGDDPTAVISQHINMRDLDKAVLLAERAVDFARSHRLPVEEDAAWAWVAGVALARADYERLEQVIEEFPGVTFPKNMTVTAWRILRGDELDEESLPQSRKRAASRGSPDTSAGCALEPSCTQAAKSRPARSTSSGSTTPEQTPLYNR